MTRQGYIICTSPRSGSTLLCRMLTEIRHVGAPASLFYETMPEGWATRFKLKPSASWDEIRCAAIERGRAGSNIFALRQQWSSFAALKAVLAQEDPNASSTAERLITAFGPITFIYLTREDKLGQAISLIRAEQTGLWHANADGSDHERSESTREGGYDAAEITRCMAELHEAERGWQAWFQAEHITPLKLSYEALSNDPKGAVAQVLGALNLDPALAGTIEVPTKKLADATTADWAARYARSGT